MMQEKQKKMSPSTRLVFMALNKISDGQLKLIMPDGTEHKFGDLTSPTAVTLKILDIAALNRILRNGSLGFAEAYMEGAIMTDDLSELLTLLSRNLDKMRGIIERSTILRFVNRLIHIFRPNSRRGAKKNIHAHYDLGNDFYKLWLDPSMTYSSARFANPNLSLEQAQHAKYSAITKIADIRAEHDVLEIGCGWGGFAEYAGNSIKCNLTGITISAAQLEFARARMTRNKVDERVNLIFKDYRDLKEKFDRIISIEMFEAVGQQYWGEYFQKIHDVLKPGGKAGLQIITIRDRDFDRYRKGVDFIQRYIFPGGMLPSSRKLREHFDRAHLREYAYESFALDYARTLALWKRNFLDNWASIKAQGFDERFKNMWCYYLSYCEAGFRTGAIDVVQIGLAKD